MGSEDWVLLLMVVGIPGSIAFFVWSALQSTADSVYIRPIWILLLKGRQNGNDYPEDWGGGGGWPSPGPCIPPSGVRVPPDGEECRRRQLRERAATT